MPKYKLVTWIVAMLIIVSMLCSLLAPTPSGNDWLTFHAYFAAALGVAVAFSSAAIIFIIGMAGFTDRLRQTYRLICLSLVILGVAFLQLPLILYLVDFSTYWKDNSITGVLFILALIMVYAGARSLARLFGIKNMFTNLWFQLGASILFAAAVVLMPHVPTSTPELKFDGSIAATSLSAFNCGVAALLIYQTKRLASVMYTNALAWMTLSYGILSLGGLLTIIASSSVGDRQWYLLGAFPLIPLFIGGLFMVRAAYSFNSISATASDTRGWVARNFFGTPLKSQPDRAPNSVDIIIYASTLASSPRPIDPILDELRQVTARMESTAQIPAQDESTLLHIYLQLESYLVSEEKLRKFTKETLRQAIAQKLRLTESSQTTFWNRLA